MLSPPLFPPPPPLLARLFLWIPINLDGYLLSDAFESGKKQQLLSRLAANFVGWESDTAQLDNAFEKLVKALRPAAHEADSPCSKAVAFDAESEGKGHSNFSNAIMSFIMLEKGSFLET